MAKECLPPPLGRAGVEELFHVGPAFEEARRHRPVRQVGARGAVVWHELAELRWRHDDIRWVGMQRQPVERRHLVLVKVLGCSVTTDLDEPPRVQVHIGERHEHQ
jgi:hypothetical protein